jgi:uncharacterized protein YacL (UPF0231 family)
MLGRQGQALRIEERGVQEQLLEKRSDLRDPLRNAVKTLRGHGLKWARMGVVGNSMRNLWEKCGMGKNKAEKVAEMVEKAVGEGLRKVWREAAKTLRETDKEERSRISRPRETLWADMEEILMVQAQAGVDSWEEAEEKFQWR